MLINEIKAEKKARTLIMFPLKLLINSLFLILLGRQHAIIVIAMWNIIVIIESAL